METDDLRYLERKTIEICVCPKCGHAEEEYSLRQYLNPLHCPNCGFVFDRLVTKEELEEKLKVFNSNKYSLHGHKDMTLKEYKETYGFVEVDAK